MTKFSKIKLGEKIKKAREDAGLSQAKLAELVKCSQCAISELERDVRRGRVDILFRVLDALGISCCERGNMGGNDD